MKLSLTAAVVLAGGQATRMGGGDKTLLRVGGRPMLARIIAALNLTNIAISANGDPARFAAVWITGSAGWGCSPAKGPWQVCWPAWSGPLPLA